MSLIGKLEQLSLSFVFQGIETYRKTGLLVVKQDVHWVELYFRDGRLMCIGPVRPHAGLVDRMLKAGVISPQALQDAQLAMGIAQPGETRIALTLMDLGYVNHDSLRAWAAQEASEVLQVLLTWRSGELYFEDGMQPPADRLLVALSALALLPPAVPVAFRATKIQRQPQQPQYRRAVVTPPVEQQPQHVLDRAPQLQVSTCEVMAETQAIQLSASQLISRTPANPKSFTSCATPLPVMNLLGNAEAQSSTWLTPPQHVNAPQPPMRIDTSFMRPEMVLLPVDLFALRQQNPRLVITPDQWRILTRVDGRTSLQAMCRDLTMPATYVCQLAGELIAIGLVHVSMPIPTTAINELSPVSRDLHTASLASGYVVPGSADSTASTAQPRLSMAPITDTLPPAFCASVPFETKSQWGNGGNGANFVPGHGWVATPQPVPADRSAYAAQNVFANVGGR